MNVYHDLKAALAREIDDALGYEVCNQYDLTGLANDVRRYATAYMTPRSDAAHDLIDATTRERIWEHMPAYHLGHPTGERIEHADILRARRKQNLLRDMFGDDAPTVTPRAPRPVMVDRGPQEARWPSAFELAEQRMAEWREQ